MKVLFISSLYTPNGIGGAERTTQILAEALVANGHEVATVSLSPDGRSERRNINGVTAHYVPLFNTGWPWGPAKVSGIRRRLWHIVDSFNLVMGRRLGRILDEEKPDIVQAENLMGFSVSAWMAVRQRGIPLVQMIHDYYLGCANSTMYRDGAVCPRQCTDCQLLRLPRRALDGVPREAISVSKRTLEKLTQVNVFGPKTRLNVIRGAAEMVGLDTFEKVTEFGNVTLGFLGRIEPIKGLPVLLEAMSKMDGRARVIVAGTGDDLYVAALKEKFIGPNVEFIGFSRPADFFRRIDLLVVPSLWEEPFPRVIFEAFAFGVPVAASRIGGMPEIIDVGRTGLLFDVGDSSDLAYQVLEILNSGRNFTEFSSSCREKSTEFDISGRYPQFLEVWESPPRIDAVRNG